MIRRTISWPVLLTTIAALATAAVSFRALHHWQLSRVSEALLTRAHDQEREQAWLGLLALLTAALIITLVTRKTGIQFQTDPDLNLPLPDDFQKRTFWAQRLSHKGHRR